MNKIELVGRLARDPELKLIEATGKKVCNFTLAVSRSFVNLNGEKEADFIPIVVWGKIAETVSLYVKKGGLIGVTGRLQIRSFDTKEGNRKYVTEVVGEQVIFLDTKKDDIGEIV